MFRSEHFGGKGQELDHAGTNPGIAILGLRITILLQTRTLNSEPLPLAGTGKSRSWHMPEHVRRHTVKVRSAGSGRSAHQQLRLAGTALTDSVSGTGHCRPARPEFFLGWFDRRYTSADYPADARGTPGAAPARIHLEQKSWSEALWIALPASHHYTTMHAAEATVRLSEQAAEAAPACIRQDRRRSCP